MDLTEGQNLILHSTSVMPASNDGLRKSMTFFIPGVKPIKKTIFLCLRVSGRFQYPHVLTRGFISNGIVLPSERESLRKKKTGKSNIFMNHFVL